MNKEILVGHISVDSGLCWIGDPCYILHKDEKPNSIGRTWNEFCDMIKDKEYATFDHNKNIDGLGVCVGTGYGDGLYPVYAEIDGNGRVVRVTVSFK